MSVERMESEKGRRRAAKLFAVAYGQVCQVPSHEIVTLVEPEFLNPRAAVFMERRGTCERATICACPFADVNVPLDEQRSVLQALGVSERDVSRVVHVSGLAVRPDHRHKHLVRPLHEAALAWAKQSGYAHVVGQAVLPGPHGTTHAAYWTRTRSMGWRVLTEAVSHRTAPDGSPMTWLTLPY